MSRLSIRRETLIALFAKSGNACAFPGCTQELVTARNQVCHIEAANPGGPRFNPTSTDEERRSFKNLVLLCYQHHKESDDISAFDATTLLAIKHKHESLHGQKPFKVNEAFLHRLESEMESYWAGLARANQESHIIPDLAVKLRIGIPADEQFAQIFQSIDRLRVILDDLANRDSTLNDEIKLHLKLLGYDTTSYEQVSYYENPFFNRNWETHSLAVNNTLTDLIISLKQGEVRYLEEYVKTHSNDNAVTVRLEEAKGALRQIAVSAGYAD